MAFFDGVKLRRVTTAQQVSEAIADRILDGAFTPGQRLREAAIAAELGVARNTVREAVRILELSGLVHHEANRGAVVISPTPETVDALYLARSRLEAYAVSFDPTAEQLDRLEKAFGDLATATRSQDVDTIVRFDLAFHAAITAFIGSSRIDEFYAGLTRELQFFLKLLSLHDREYEENSNILPEHQRLLDAIVSGDKQRARAEVEHHIAVNHRRVREILTAVYG
ncbi:GntR family transcriptional regulator [uncultured Aeromicrobium sp.]|uniref:GntR family transcriptional regulator n=1 Tax=uncultured Aeromicrobium sp. TaxID=337820 RepID=UPI0025DF578B|nr:GntR family transcriptional regulator [uncultured Aeromicrobium sp.]